MDTREELTQIVKKVQEDGGQFELLYSQIINKVYFWCYTIAKDETVAKDMAQEAIIRIYNKLNTLHTPETFNSWMYRLVRNSCMNYLRANRKHGIQMPNSKDFDDEFETTIREEKRDNLPEEAYNLKETKKLIRSFIDKLPRMQREVITLYYLEELQTAEIAEILEYNISSVRTRLHAGRKSLEQQINDYQEKNNVKLYSTIILPLLGLILSEYRDDIFSRQNLRYEQSMFRASDSSITEKLSRTLTSKLTIAIMSLVCVGMVAAVVANVWQKQSVNKGGVGNNTASTSDIEIYSNEKGHPYIKDITYLEFQMREGVDVRIELKKEIAKKDIQILSNDEELSFDKKDKELLVRVTNNGVYTIITKGYTASFNIRNIDAYAPELVGASNENESLLLVINDEFSRIDYKRSFIVYQDKKYVLPENLKIDGKFSGIVKVTIFDYDGYDIVYDLDFK